MPKYTDGFTVFGVPEFQALAARLTGEDCRHQFGRMSSFQLELGVEEAFLTVNGHRRLLQYSGYEIYWMIEFKEFCRKFGVRHDAATVSVVIRVAEGECPSVTQHYYFEDARADPDNRSPSDDQGTPRSGGQGRDQDCGGTRTGCPIVVEGESETRSG